MASLDDVRRVQKQTRDKEYRLRKQGANQSSIDKVSPKLPWAEVEAMNNRQRDAYVKRMRNFNKNAKYVGSESGDVIPKAYITQATKFAQSYNKYVRAETMRIKGISPSLWKQYREIQKGLLAHEESIGGLLTPIDIKKMTRPRSLEVAKRRVARFEERSKRKFGYYRRIQRKNMVTMLNTLNLYDLSELVRTMPSDNFDVLSSVLPMWENLSVEYASNTKVNNYDNLRAYVYKAHMLGKKDPKRSYAALERNRDYRHQRGIDRANGVL